MRRLDRLGMKDIIRKRANKTSSSEVCDDNKNQVNLLQNLKQAAIQNIIAKLLKSDSKTNHKCQILLEQRYSIIEHMSLMQKISYNKNTLAALITIWRVPTVAFVDNSNTFHMNDSENSNVFGGRPLNFFFLLCGQAAIYQKNQDDSLQRSSSPGVKTTFQTQSKPNLKSMTEGIDPICEISENEGYGPIFKKKGDEKQINTITKISNAIVIEIKEPQIQNMMLNLGGMDQDRKLKIIETFPVFSSISKKIQNLLPYIELKKYNKNQHIYKMKQQPQAVYLILKGQVIFQVKIDIPKQKKTHSITKSLPDQCVLQTETLGVGSYFGEEQIITKQNRTVNSICHSAQCDLLEIPVQKFQKLLNFSDFYESVKQSVNIKIAKRKQKIQKALQIHIKFNKSSQKFIDQDPEKMKSQTTIGSTSTKSIRKKQSQPAKIMHGNVIHVIPKSFQSEPVNFSMLAANPDMYQSTLKKFRKYSIKPAQKYKPQVDWSLKRVWKVLNLQSVLREDAELTSPQGRKFFDSSRRLHNHVQQVKSIRPKTSSSTYRTKLQYIAYLQQFNN